MSPACEKCFSSIILDVSKLNPPTKTIESKFGLGARSLGGASSRTTIRLPNKKVSWSTVMARCASSAEAIVTVPATPAEVENILANSTSPACCINSLSWSLVNSSGKLPMNTLQWGSVAPCASWSGKDLLGGGWVLSMTCTLTSRPSSILPFKSLAAACACSRVSNSTFPAHFDCSVSRFMNTVANVIGPKGSHITRKASASVSGLRPPKKT
mmetsp:Transcript_62594/g.123695  ORF Transcript_62594/g.123695 Transcript_62594/m.123695 type:complete len:212 (-) Transcript_62594:682-1317(-)